MTSYSGSLLIVFSSSGQAPAILTHDALLKVVTLLTGRYSSVIKKRGNQTWIREIYRSLAVHDRGIQPNVEEQSSHGHGFAIDDPGGDDEEIQDDDELVLAALDSMDAIDVFKHGEQSNVHHSIIPTDNFLKLVELLLLIAAIDPQESISTFAAQLSDERVAQLRQTAKVRNLRWKSSHGSYFSLLIQKTANCLA